MYVSTAIRLSVKSPYLVRVWVVDLIQSKHGGEFFVDESVHDNLYCLVCPFLQRLLDCKFIHKASHGLLVTSVTCELFLQCVDRIGLCTAVRNLHL